MNNFFVRLGLGQKRPAAGGAASIVLLFSLHFCAFAANPNACDIVKLGFNADAGQTGNSDFFGRASYDGAQE